MANADGQTISVFTPSGSAYSGSPFGGAGTISEANSVAIDAPGNVWIANSGNSSVTELSSAGTYIRNITQNIAAPAGLAINPK